MCNKTMWENDIRSRWESHQSRGSSLCVNDLRMVGWLDVWLLLLLGTYCKQPERCFAFLTLSLGSCEELWGVRVVVRFGWVSQQEEKFVHNCHVFESIYELFEWTVGDVGSCDRLFMPHWKEHFREQWITWALFGASWRLVLVYHFVNLMFE